jgi:membrane-associated phospholipid phosphatase
LIIVFWSILFGILYVFPEYIAARSGLSLRDAALARADEGMGLAVPNVLRFMDEHHPLKHFFLFWYDSILVFFVAAIMVPPVCGRMTRAKEFSLASIASALIAFPLSALVPAVGPWHHYGYAPTAEQEKVMNVFLSLRGSEPFLIDFASVEGVIAFPSFHTVLAVLAAFALWPIPYVRWPAVLVATFIVVSTVTTGWHYGVDAIAGVILVLASCRLGMAITALENKRLHAEVDTPQHVQ